MRGPDHLPLLTTARHARAYLRRLRYWALVQQELAGEGEGDRRVLRRALLGAPRDSLTDLSRWRDPMLTEDARLRATGVGVFDVRAQTDDLFHVLPSGEPAVLRTLRELLRPGDTFVDAGANIGFYSVAAYPLVGPEGRIVSVEMMPETAARLRQHLQMNAVSNAEVVERALSNEAGAKVVACVPTGKHGQASIVQSFGARGDDVRTVEVLTTTLDTILSDLPEVRLMKVDLEGAELRALQGARDSLGKIAHVIYEDWNASDDVLAFWDDAGFDVRVLDGRNRLASRRPYPRG